MFNPDKVTVDFNSNTGSNTVDPVSIKVRSDVAALNEEMVRNRRWFHAHPELSFQEYKTAEYIAKELRTYGIAELWEQVGRTGIVAMIRGDHPGPTIALRADMDALPIQETGDCPFISQNPGVQHACGHDGHVSMLLAAAKVIHAVRQQLHGNVKLLFQPAEEGFGGAREMIKDGCLTDKFGTNVDAIYGAHLWSYDKVGKIGARQGPMMAASDKFEIDVLGRGGHGAAPESTVDAVVVAANVVTALQSVVSRNLSPLEAGVVTCGTINGGFGYNIIADKVTITGTCRSFTKETQQTIEQRMNGICCGLGSAYNANINLHYHYGYPPTINRDKASVDRLHSSASKIVGKENTGVPYITCGAEDFSYFLELKPGCFFFIGAGLPGELRPHHKSVFDFDEAALGIGASIFVQLIEDLLITQEKV